MAELIPRTILTSMKPKVLVTPALTLVMLLDNTAAPVAVSLILPSVSPRICHFLPHGNRKGEGPGGTIPGYLPFGPPDLDRWWP